MKESELTLMDYLRAKAWLKYEEQWLPQMAQWEWVRVVKYAERMKLALGE